MLTTIHNRPPAVAGRFYPSDPQALAAEVQAYLSEPSPGKKAKRAIGCIAPHAGYTYSGHVAGAVFARVQVPARCIVLCPNHTGMGVPLAIMSAGFWDTPLGNIPLDSALAESLKNRFPALEEDEAAHRAEHSAEVELPFLLSRQPKLTFVPIALGTQNFDVLEQLGYAVADAVAALEEEVLIVASSDMNHYESDAITRVKDHRAIEKILALQAHGLYDVVTQQRISMCGLSPTVVMLTAARKLGATSADLVKYATSGDVSGDRDMVVGYSGIAVY